jgi:hypothetical protein
MELIINWIDEKTGDVVFSHTDTIETGGDFGNIVNDGLSAFRQRHPDKAAWNYLMRCERGVINIPPQDQSEAAQ